MPPVWCTHTSSWGCSIEVARAASYLFLLVFFLRAGDFGEAAFLEDAFFFGDFLGVAVFFVATFFFGDFFLAVFFFSDFLGAACFLAVPAFFLPVVVFLTTMSHSING